MEKINKNVTKKCNLCRKPDHLAKSFSQKTRKEGLICDAFICTVEDVEENEIWLVDSGVTAYKKKFKSYFFDYESFDAPKKVLAAMLLF